MIHRLRHKAGQESGFTLVELLVVMLILGLLAAIAIPSFFNQREKARDADAKSMVNTAQTGIEAYSTDNQGLYTGATTARLVAMEATLDPARLTVTVTPDSYTISVSSDSGNVFTIHRLSSGSVEFTCTTAGYAGCPSSGHWD